MTKIKVLIITNDLAGGGAAAVMLNTARMLIQRGHSVDLLCQKNVNEFNLDDNINLNIGMRRFNFGGHIIQEFFLRRYILKLDRNIKGYNLILSTYVTIRKFLPSQLLNKTYFYAHLDYRASYSKQFNENPREAARLKRKLTGFYSGKNMIAVSEGAKNYLLNDLGIQPKNAVTIYNFFDFSAIINLANKPLTKNIKKPYIIHSARFDLALKRQDILFEAFKGIPEPYHLVLLTNLSDELSNLIKQHNLEHRITVAGFQKNPHNWMKNAALSVLCSDSEGFGNVLVESLICGTPIVSTDCPSGPIEIMAGSLSKYLVPCGNPNALRERILETLKKPPEISKIDIDRFSFEQGYKNLLTLLEL